MRGGHHFLEMEQARHNLVFWFLSERRPRVIEMKSAGPWTHHEVVDAILGGRHRSRVEFYEFAPPDVGAALPEDGWLQPSHVYYARRLPAKPAVETYSRERGYYRRVAVYSPYGPHMPVLKGLHGRV